MSNGPCASAFPSPLSTASSEQPIQNEPQQPTAFTGGSVVFYPERVELCGVDICSGPRTETRRILLELLAKQRKNGDFIAYSGQDLEDEGRRLGADRTAAPWIRDLRQHIERCLLTHANIECKGDEVILSGGPGYRFAPSLTVHQAGVPEITDIKDTAGETDVPNVRYPDVRDVPDDAALPRRAWILQRLASGDRLQAPAVARHFKCSVKTAQRDLTALKEEGKIEFVGPPRTGFYLLRDRRDSLG